MADTKNNNKTIASVDSNLTPEGAEVEKIQNAEIANEYAQTKGAESIQTMNSNLVSQIAAGGANALVAKEIASKTVSDLLLLTLQQEITGTPEVAYMNITDKFEDGYIATGNNREYIFEIPTGSESFDPDPFIPNKRTPPLQTSWNLSIYEKDANGNTVLAKGSYQFKKPFTITENEWLPYFMSGRLNEFISKYRKMLRQSYRMFKFDTELNLLKQINAKTIKGSADNMFNAFVKEIIPEMSEMQTLTNEYNADTNEANARNVLVATPFSKLNILMSNKNKTRIQTGIMTQLFNAKLFNYEGVLSNDRIHSVGNELVIGDSDTPIKVSTSPYVDDNTVYVFTDDLIKHVYQIEKAESQYFTNNLALQLTIHIWGTMGVLPWGQIFKYTNPNLSKLPSEE